MMFLCFFAVLFILIALGASAGPVNRTDVPLPDEELYAD